MSHGAWLYESGEMHATCSKMMSKLPHEFLVLLQLVLLIFKLGEPLLDVRQHLFDPLFLRGGALEDLERLQLAVVVHLS